MQTPANAEVVQAQAPAADLPPEPPASCAMINGKEYVNSAAACRYLGITRQALYFQGFRLPYLVLPNANGTRSRLYEREAIISYPKARRTWKRGRGMKVTTSEERVGASR